LEYNEEEEENGGRKTGFTSTKGEQPPTYIPIIYQYVKQTAAEKPLHIFPCCRLCQTQPMSTNYIRRLIIIHHSHTNGLLFCGVCHCHFVV
jgi:hypothetical protein